MLCSSMDRRRFLVSSAAAVSTASARRIAFAAAPTSAMLIVAPEKVGPMVPADFLGLSYEKMQLADPAFFSANNKKLVGLFKTLAPASLRLGGRTSEFSWWRATAETAQPERQITSRSAASEPVPELRYAVTPQAIQSLAGFLDATRWSCIYGLNLGTGTVDENVAEAEYVASKLGKHLDFFQLGNEVDLYGRHLRDADAWTVEAFVEEWIQQARAIHRRVPGVRFGLPDIAWNPEWFHRIAELLAAEKDLPQIAALTHHYYFVGAPSNPNATIPQLFGPDQRIVTTAEAVHDAAMSLKTRYRMTEGNSCYDGGKPGLSDTFASALWVADYLLKLALLGYSGANIHGGSSAAIAAALGGKLPGEELIPENEAHPRPFYTPIAENNGTYAAQPVFDGMLLAATLTNCTLCECHFDIDLPECSAYAAFGSWNSVRVVLINKSDRDLSLRIKGCSGVYVFRLTGGSLSATTTQGKKPWEPGLAEHYTTSNGIPPTFLLPRYSAAFVNTNLVGPFKATAG